MPSSISSSESSQWGRTWLLALVLAGLALAGIERHWRARGFEPAVSDSARLWTAHRLRAQGLRRPGSVIVGASRTQFGIDLAAFADGTGWPEPVQLSIQGRSPLPVLQDLAADPSFSGLVLMEVTERILFEADGRREAQARDRVVEAKELATNLTLPVESWMDSAVSGRLAFRSPELSPNRLLALWQAGYPVTPRERWVTVDRSAKIDFDRVDGPVLEKRWLRRLVGQKPPDDAFRDSVIDDVAAAARAIRERGGEVVLVRMPSSGRLGRMEERKFPRARFWDVLVDRVGGPAIHHADHEGLRTTVTPDGSHIGVDDAPAFTRELATIVVQGVGPATP